MKKLVIGVPCYNDADCVRTTLAPLIDEYRDYGVDVYYYDSSDNNEIRDIILDYRSRGYDNVYHIHFDRPVVPKKTELFFGGYGFEDTYEYLWPIKTASCITPGLLRNLMEALEGEYDAVYLDVLGALDQTAVTEDAAGLYNAFGWSATSIDVTIYRKDSLLSGYAWSEEMLNSSLETMPSFSHWYILFSELARLEHPRILILDRKKVRLSGIERAELRYVDRIFEVWEDDWVNANDALPEMYAPYRDKVIKEAAGKPHLIAYVPRLQDLHNKGLLTRENVEKVLKNWERISDIPKDVVREIADGTFCPTDHSAEKLPLDGYDEEIGVLSKIFYHYSQGALPREELPIEDMALLLEERVKEAFRKNEKFVSEKLTEGTVRDLKNYLSDPGRTKQELSDTIQLMGLMLSLARLAFGEQG